MIAYSVFHPKADAKKMLFPGYTFHHSGWQPRLQQPIGGGPGQSHVTRDPSNSPVSSKETGMNVKCQNPNAK
jgi:hypothetical protein